MMLFINNAMLINHELPDSQVPIPSGGYRHHTGARLIASSFNSITAIPSATSSHFLAT